MFVGVKFVYFDTLFVYHTMQITQKQKEGRENKNEGIIHVQPETNYGEFV